MSVTWHHLIDVIHTHPAVPWFGDAGIDMPEPQGSDRTPFRGGETEALARLDRVRDAMMCVLSFLSEYDCM